MARSKLVRFAEIREFENVVEGRESETYNGKWREEFFHRDAPLIVELACGKGEYSLAIAERCPEVNVLGVDRKGERIWKGAKQALNAGFTHCGFLRGDIRSITNDFDAGEVSEIWITFPDPFPRDRQEKHRLTAPDLLKLYGEILLNTSAAQGVLHLKTDDRPLLEYSLQTLTASGWDIEEYCTNIDERDDNLGNGSSTLPIADLLRVQTTFEKKHRALGKQIGYIRAHLSTTQDR